MKKKSTALAQDGRSARRFIRFLELKQRIGLSKTTIWRKTREGTFPKPVSLSSGIVAWLEDEVEDWIDDRIAARHRRNHKTDSPDKASALKWPREAMPATAVNADRSELPEAINAVSPPRRKEKPGLGPG